MVEVAAAALLVAVYGVCVFTGVFVDVCDDGVLWGGMC